jgi:alkanesulfonate monooxygenase SsuD/methylene tetrahydromethanopterin reductase-like flavin-dependent oxidoreductase (luciferase family)
VGYRHPAVLAKAITAIDLLSGGRADMGIGAGWAKVEYDAYGIEFPGVKTRMDQLEEGIQCLRGLLHGDVTSFAGEHFTLTGARCEPKPIQRPHPPICIGGTGTKRTIPAAARFAQHWNHPGGSVDDWLAAREVLWVECDRIGRNPAEITTSIHLLADAAEPGRTAEHAAAFAEAGLDLGIVYVPPPHSPAVLEAHAVVLEPLLG